MKTGDAIETLCHGVAVIVVFTVIGTCCASWWLSDHDNETTPLRAYQTGELAGKFAVEDCPYRSERAKDWWQKGYVDGVKFRKSQEK